MMEQNKTIEREDVNLPAVIAFGIVTVCLVYLSVVGLMALYYKVQDEEYKRKTYSEKPLALINLNAEQEKLLTEYRWVDKHKGIAAIPIEEAIKLTVEDISRGITGWQPGREFPTKGINSQKGAGESQVEDDMTPQKRE